LPGAGWGEAYAVNPPQHARRNRFGDAVLFVVRRARPLASILVIIERPCTVNSHTTAVLCLGGSMATGGGGDEVTEVMVRAACLHVVDVCNEREMATRFLFRLHTRECCVRMRASA